MQKYEEMKARVLTAIALEVTEDKIRALHEPMLVDNGGLMGEDALISMASTCTNGWFAATSLSESHLLNYSFSFTALEEERERLLNKPEWPEDEIWKACAADENGAWYFYKDDFSTRLGTTERGFAVFSVSSGDIEIDSCMFSGAIAVFPAGYSWKESLEFRPE